MTSIEIRYLAVSDVICTSGQCMTRNDIRNSIFSIPEYVKELLAAGVNITAAINYGISDISRKPGIKFTSKRRRKAESYQALSMWILDDALEKVLNSALEIYVDDVTDDIIEIVYPGTVGLSEQVINRILKTLGKTVYDYPNASIVF